MEQTENFEGVRCDITMHRTLYLSREENVTDEQFIDKARSEIKLPHNVLVQVDALLQRSGIKISGLDLKDWNVDDVKYTIYSDNKQS